MKTVSTADIVARMAFALFLLATLLKIAGYTV